MGIKLEMYERMYAVKQMKADKFRYGDYICYEINGNSYHGIVIGHSVNDKNVFWKILCSERTFMAKEQYITLIKPFEQVMEEIKVD